MIVWRGGLSLCPWKNGWRHRGHVALDVFLNWGFGMGALCTSVAAHSLGGATFDVSFTKSLWELATLL